MRTITNHFTVLDPLSRSVCTILLSVTILSASRTCFLALLFGLASFLAWRSEVPRALAFSAALAPALPIGTSHLIIEPLAKGIMGAGGSLSVLSILVPALRTWAKLSALSLVALAWIVALSLRDVVQLVRLLHANGRYHLPMQIAVTSLNSLRIRWMAIREVRALSVSGARRQRVRVPLRDLGWIAAHFVIASLAPVGEIALAAEGRGFARTHAPVGPPLRVTLAGATWMTVFVTLCISVLLNG